MVLKLWVVSVEDRCTQEKGNGQSADWQKVLVCVERRIGKGDKSWSIGYKSQVDGVLFPHARAPM